MSSNKPYLVCLTGGIASGKTTVSNKLQELGVKIIDTDIIARLTVEKGTKGLAALVDAFGESIIDDAGGLNRSHLRSIVFSDPKLRDKLNSITHPLIRMEMMDMISKSQETLIVVVIPLYVGQKEFDFFNRVCVVDIREDEQLRRLEQRDGVTHKLAKNMLLSQITRMDRLMLADDVLSNKYSIGRLLNSVEMIARYYDFLADEHIEACQ